MVCGLSYKGIVDGSAGDMYEDISDACPPRACIMYGRMHAGPNGDEKHGKHHS